MKANLYISDETFLYNGSDSYEDVVKKLKRFAVFFNYLMSNDDIEDSILLTNNDFYSIPVLPDKTTMNDILFTKMDAFRDIRELMFQYLSNMEHKGFSKQEFVEFLNNSNELNAIIVLNLPNNSGNMNQYVIFDKDDWINFHREHLYSTPHRTTEAFIKDIPLYFENIVIHEDNVTIMKNVYKTHLKQITVYLGYLNDFLLKDYHEYVKNNQGNFISFLTCFAKKYHIDDASFEGKKKEVFKISFSDPERECYCEPHLKMYKNDKGEKGKHCRIYFAPIEKGDKKVFVGMIREHI